MKTYYTKYLKKQTKPSIYEKMNWLKKVFFGYGFYIIDKVRKVGYPKDLPIEAIP